MKICFIGYGHMAKAIAQKLLSEKENELYASAPSLSIGKDSQGIYTHCNNTAHIAQADMVILAVKPAQMAAVMEEINTHLPKTILLISIAAGLNLSWFQTRIKEPLPIVRAMPNLAAAIGQSATALIANNQTSASQKQLVTKIFNHIGVSFWLQQEREMDIFTAVAGSGPAYVFYFAEAMIEAATMLGLNTSIANQSILQTFIGATQLMLERLNLGLTENQSNNTSTPSLSKIMPSLSDLRKEVTSEGGTTAAAMEVFNHLGLSENIAAAIKAAYTRARELQEIYQRSV